jgi:pimeloyl-ACP methyl ester carboxylesterase
VTAVFVNGNPETSAIWDSLLGELDRRDTLRLSPPGFGAPIPDGFPCTGSAYSDWLIEALEALGQPVDLVGHDVGGSITLRVAMARPDLLRSWVSDSLGTYDPEYVWHDLARGWQSPETGEAAVAERLGGTVEERADRLEPARGGGSPGARDRRHRGPARRLRGDARTVCDPGRRAGGALGRPRPLVDGPGAGSRSSDPHVLLGDRNMISLSRLGRNILTGAQRQTRGAAQRLRVSPGRPSRCPLPANVGC